MKKPSISARLKQFSHLAYAIIWDSLPAAQRRGDVRAVIEAALRDSITAPATGFLTASDLGLGQRNVGVTIRPSELETARVRLRSMMLGSLLIDLDSFFGEELRQIAKSREIRNAIAKNRAAVLKALRSDWEGSRYLWAYIRAIELSCIRNCIAHGDREWTLTAVNRMSEELPRGGNLPKQGDPIEISVRAFIFYKSAVRTILNILSAAD